MLGGAIKLKRERTLMLSCQVSASRCSRSDRALTWGDVGKLLEVNQQEKKAQGKYSLEGALLLKTHAALQALKGGEAV